MILSIFEKAGIEVTQQGKVKDVFASTGLDWLVEQKEVFVNDGSVYDSGQYIDSYTKVPKLVANYRSDNNQFLGMVHPTHYKVIQNIEAFDFIDELPNFTFEKVGMFNNGQKVFVVGKSNDQIEIDSGDLIDFYLTFLHGHDGKSGIRFILSPIRMFCMNQMNLMLSQATFKYNIQHTGDIQYKLSQIQRAIANSKNYVNTLQGDIESMINSKVTIDITDFASKVLPSKDDDTQLAITRKEEARSTIINLYNNKPDLQNYKGTSFGMLSAVSDYISHLEPKRSNADINNMFIKNIEGNDLLQNAREVLRLAA